VGVGGGRSSYINTSCIKIYKCMEVTCVQIYVQPARSHFRELHNKCLCNSCFM